MLNRATTLTELGAAPTTEELVQPKRVGTNIRRLTKLDPAVPDTRPEALSA